MKFHIFKILFILLPLLFSFSMYAQVTVSGRVIGNDEPDGLTGVSVSLESQDNQYNTVTGDNGHFSIENVQGSAVGIQYELKITHDYYRPHRSIEGVTNVPLDVGVIRLEEIAWAPRNITAIENREEQVVDLQWLSAGPFAGTEQWLQYCSGQNTAGVGTDGPAEFDVAVRFTSDQLEALEATGLYVTAVRFLPYVENATYIIKVYRGGSGEPLTPGEEVASQPVDQFNFRQWNEVILDNPVEIEMHQELWFGYSVNTPEGHPAGCDSGPAVRYFGDLMAFGGNWMSMAEVHEIDRNWNLQAFAGFTRGDKSVKLTNRFVNGSERIIAKETLQENNLDDVKLEVKTRYSLDDKSLHSRRDDLPSRDSHSLTYRELESYNIFRFNVQNQDNPEQWDYLANIEATDTTYTDTTWDETGEGLFRYAVQAVYTDNVLSRKALSNVVYPRYFSGGVGTRYAPWEIETAEDLDTIRLFLGEEHYDKYFIQTADIDLGVAPWNDGEGWQPIGDSDDGFFGNYNGAGHEITNMTIDTNIRHTGLFGYIESAYISGVNLKNIDINAARDTGGITGYSRNSTIINCSATGNIRGANYIGLLVGYATIGTFIQNCYTAGSVTATSALSCAGGLVGYATGTGQISNCYSTADVNGNRNRIGGLVGGLGTGIVVNSYATGTITATEDTPYEIGGLVGTVITGEVFNSYWNVETTGQTVSAGGGEGKTTAQLMELETFFDWDFENIWNISFEQEDTYPYLLWQEQPHDSNYPPSKIPPSYLYAGTPNDATVRLTWASPSLGEPDGFKIYRDNIHIHSVASDVTQYDDNNVNNLTSYKYHITAEYGEHESLPSNSSTVTPVPGGYAGGLGTVDSPYQIDTVTRLDYVRHNLLSNYIQTQDIDLENIENWEPIGDNSEPFQGSYNGNNYSISNLTIDRNQRYQGLFGYAQSDVFMKLKNIYLDEVNITADRYVGGLVGYTRDGVLIKNCHVSGSILLTSTLTSIYGGGIVGYARDTDIINSSVRGEVISPGGQGGRMGGIAGYYYYGTLENSFSTADIEGERYTGGLVGYFRGDIVNCYALGDVNSTDDDVGGLIGYNIYGNIYNSYSAGRIIVPQDSEDVGGLIGRSSGNTYNSYWDRVNSGIDVSDGGEARQTNHMTYPHAQDTYVDWNFQDIWQEDRTGRINDGYPYFQWLPIEAGPNPDIASNPQPQNQATDISSDLNNVGWSYIESQLFTNPVGFRIYMNTTGEFGDDDPFVWIPYIDNQENYQTAAILPDEMHHNTTYYWKVVPTTIPPGRADDDCDLRLRRSLKETGRSSRNDVRGDAEDVPVWRFTTGPLPYPVIAHNPQPENEAANINVALDRLSWSYTKDEDHSNPIGFRVYLNTTGVFTEEDDFHWEPFSENQSNYSTSAILPEELQYDTTYYWKVVPTTEFPGRRTDYGKTQDYSDYNKLHAINRVRESRGQNISIRQSSFLANNETHFYRNDAPNVPIWSFTTLEINPKPKAATNPSPENMATGITTELESVSWDYESCPNHTNPVGFRVYLNMNGTFPPHEDFAWVDYVEDQVTYSNSDIVPTHIDPHSTYYWKVVPTTELPNKARREKKDYYTAQKHESAINYPCNTSEVLRERRLSLAVNRSSKEIIRTDADNVQVWRFTTGSTGIEEEIYALPNETKLHGNYPNPFNPQTKIRFSLAKPGLVIIEVFNSKAQKIITLVNDHLEPGNHEVIWDARDKNNNEVGSGVYLYRIRKGNYASTSKMILMK